MRVLAVILTTLFGLGVVAFFTLAALGIAAQPGLDGTQFGQFAGLALLGTVLTGIGATTVWLWVLDDSPYKYP